MFCSNCGNDDQKENSYCRNCGEFLSDLTKKNKMVSFGGDTPEEQIKTNLYLNLLSALVSLVLAILLWVSFYGQDAPPLVYLTIGFLAAMSGWQFSTCYVGLKLKKNFSKRREDDASKNQTEQQTRFEPAKTKELLNEVDFTSVVPTSVTENTTKHLPEKINRKLS